MAEFMHESDLEEPIPQRAQEMLDLSEKARLFCLDLLKAGQYFLQKGVRQSLVQVKEEIRFLFQRFTVFDFVCCNLNLAGLLLSSLVFFAGIGIVGYQSFVWIKDGVWNAMPLMAVFDFLFENTALQEWVHNPASWTGLHQVIEWNLTNVPLSLVLIVEGGLLSAGLLAMMVLAILIRRFQFKHSGPLAGGADS